MDYHPTSTETRVWGKQMAAGLAMYTGKGVAPEMNLPISCMPQPSANNAAHSDFENQNIYHQKSKTEVSVAPKMDMCPPKIYKNGLSIEPNRRKGETELPTFLEATFNPTRELP